MSTTAYADSDIVYSFDGDWGNDAVLGRATRRTTTSRATTAQRGDAEPGPAPREHGDGARRRIRLARGRLRAAPRRGQPAARLLRGRAAAIRCSTAHYEATNLAAYGEAEWRAAGRRDADRRACASRRARPTTTTATAPTFAPRDTMVGGHLSLHGRARRSGSTWYATVEPRLQGGRLQHRRSSCPTTGASSSPSTCGTSSPALRLAQRRTARCRSTLAVFYMWREDQQVATSFQLDPGDPLSYVFYHRQRRARPQLRARGLAQLAASGRRCTLGATLGLLQSEYLDYQLRRPQPRRPRAGAVRRATSTRCRREWGVGPRLDGARGRDAAATSFYFDTSHDQRSNAVHAREPEGRLRVAAAGRCTPGAATCSTRSTRCAASISGSSRRTTPTSCTSSVATRAARRASRCSGAE